MDEASKDGGYCFPTIERVELSAFDLYRRKPDVTIDVQRHVFCLIGANGLGKSTYLNSLLYGLTGGIPYRERSFSSPGEYAAEATRGDRRDDYYQGRLSDTAAARATITMRLRWQHKSASVTRQLVGSGAVMALDVWVDGEATPVTFPETEAESAYRNLVVEECGMPSFDQFVFLMHYVCAFDEGRHLLLWDAMALTNALYLAFGSDAEHAARASDLKREVERQGSRARNSRFAARQSLDEAKRLQKMLSGDDGGVYEEATLERYRRLNERLDEAAQRSHRKDLELRKSEAKVTDRSAALTGLQVEYESVFAARADAFSTVRHHPLIRSTLRGDQCAVCASTGVAEKIQSLIESGACPLCGNAMASSCNDSALLDKLKVLDQQIEETRAELEEVIQRCERLKEDHATSVHAEEAAREAREDFLASHPDVDRQARSEAKPDVVNVEVKRLLAAAERLDRQSKQEYQKRDQARRALHAIERELQSRFDEHSERFTELFRKSAEAFVGLTVDIELEHHKGKNETGFELLLSLEDQIRARADDVSESQRFFLDIALRMALAEFMSPGVATLLIDTPEGSLDITYEARAGQMFSEFAERRNRIVMTANLRSSALLRRLAERQKYSGMQIERMTNWTDLSEVQQAEEKLFDEAYEEIERALQ